MVANKGELASDKPADGGATNTVLWRPLPGRFLRSDNARETDVSGRSAARNPNFLTSDIARISRVAGRGMREKGTFSRTWTALVHVATCEKWTFSGISSGLSAPFLYATVIAPLGSIADNFRDLVLPITDNFRNSEFARAIFRGCLA